MGFTKVEPAPVIWTFDVVPVEAPFLGAHPATATIATAASTHVAVVTPF
jgi:hypothetical protein